MVALAVVAGLVVISSIHRDQVESARRAEDDRRANELADQRRAVGTQAQRAEGPYGVVVDDGLGRSVAVVLDGHEAIAVLFGSGVRIRLDVEGAVVPYPNGEELFWAHETLEKFGTSLITAQSTKLARQNGRSNRDATARALRETAPDRLDVPALFERATYDKARTAFGLGSR